MIAETVGQYRITSELGRGRFGITYRGEHIANKTSAVIKQLDPELTQDDQFHRRFTHETENVVRFYHANLANILALVSQDQNYYYITEDISGSNLAEYLTRKNKLSLVQTAEILLAVCAALEYLHQRQYYHQHLHLGNIIINKEGTVKLTDFGLATLIGSSGTTKALHKPDARYSQYIAPEQRLGQPANEHSDIYPLGVLLYELITGEQFESRSSLGTIPVAVQKIIAKCTAENPVERYPAVTDIAADISQFLLIETTRAAAGTELAALSVLTPVSKKINPVWWLIWSLALVIIIALPLYYLIHIRGLIESPSSSSRGVPFQRQHLPYSTTTETAVAIETSAQKEELNKTELIKEETMFEAVKEIQPTPEIILPLTKETSYEAVTSVQSGRLTGVGTNTTAPPGESLNISPEDTSPMTYTIQPEPSVQVVVPAGNFIFGSNTGNINEFPQRQVFVDTFLIDAYEVSNDQYAAFIQATGHPTPSGWKDRFYPLGQAKFPVTGITWSDASAYAAWLGCRLPTEVEWEKAARGTDGKTYPWGNQFIAAACNFSGSKLGRPAQIGTYIGGRSPYGVYEMAGNIAEWVADVYQPYAGNTALPILNSDPNLKVIRGGAFDTDQDSLRCSARVPKNGTTGYADVGFRTVRPLLGTPAVAYRTTTPILLKLSCIK
jgi:formylglycine-generating enzyme required for sulfatase activity